MVDLYTPNRPGEKNLAGGDAEELFRAQYMAEVLTAFATAVRFQDKQLVRTIENGNSAKFPATWKTDAEYHVVGTELTGAQGVAHNERTILVDDKLISDIFVAEIDELKNHYDVRSIYTTEQGRALARRYDETVARCILKAARSDTTFSTVGNGGDVISDGADYDTDMDNLVEAISKAGAVLDEKDVPEEDRFVALNPTVYRKLAKHPEVMDSDYDGPGSMRTGKAKELLGFTLVKTNQLPSDNTAPEDRPAGEKNDYSGDFTKTVAAVWQKNAVGTVKLLDLALEQEYKVSRQGTLLVAKYILGHGILRPECAVEIRNNA